MKSRLRRAVDGVLQLQDTPHRIALAFGLGVWIAFSPLLGLHTVMALGAAFAFRLSRAALLMGAYVNNPWTIAPLYLAGTALGCALLGVSTAGLESIEWHHHGMTFYRELVAHLRPYLWPYVVGNTILGTVGGAVAYVMLRAFLERRRRAPVGAPP
jgi:uncharacterized protein (DUF2062 family)